jgi:hypothetical protein
VRHRSKQVHGPLISVIPNNNHSESSLNIVEVHIYDRR